MKKILSTVLVLSMCLAMMVTLTSCGAPKDAGAEIAVYFGEGVYDFDPTDYYEDSNARQLMSLLFEPLFTLNENGKLGYDIAKSYEINEEDNTIVITLRESYWSDEVQVTASDFVYSWRDVILEPNNPNPAAALLYDIENALEVKSGEKSIYELGVVATSPTELTIKCRDGADYSRLLKNLASINTAPLREDVVTKDTKPYWTKTLSIIVTNGPFQVNSINQETGEFTVARNLGYHQKSTVKNYVKEVTPAKLISFISADMDEITLTYSDVVSKTVFYLADTSLEDRKENKDKAITKDDLSTYAYVFNTEHPLFANADVRRALSLALDREAMAEAVTFATAANGFLPNAVSGTLEDRISTSDKISEAQEILDGVNLTGISKTFTLSVNDDAASIAMANLAKAAWEELGFKVRIDTLGTVKRTVNDKVTNSDLVIFDSELQVLIKEASYGNRDFDVVGLDIQMYSTDPFVALAAFTSHMNGNGVDYESGDDRLHISGWSLDEYDKLIDKAYNAKTENARNDALSAAEKLLLANAPIAPVVYNTSFGFFSSDVSGVKFDGFSNLVFTKANLKNYEQYLDD